MKKMLVAIGAAALLAFSAIAQTPSPDGTTITAPTAQTLVTADGTWSFGTEVQPWGFNILLNGVQASGVAQTLKVANAGKLYAVSQGNWYVYQGGGFVASSDPSAGGGAVTRIIAGTNVTITPSTGLGDVTINSSGAQGPPGPAGSGGGFPVVTTQAAFVAAVNDAFANCYVVNFGNGSRFVVTGRMNFTVKDCGQDPVGWNGHGLRITNENNGVNDGGGIIQIQTQGQVSRSLFVAGTAIYGGGYQGANSGDCLRITALRNNAIYKFTARDLWMDYCGNGLALVGDVFEASIYNHHGENNNGSGIYMNHGTDCGIISNIFLFGPNESRNKRYGIELDTRQGCGGVSSVHMYAPTMVSNAIGGILATGGVRSIWGGNCENSGLVCVDVGNSPYQTVIMGMEMSTDNSTNAGVNGSQAAKYLLRFPAAENARLYFPAGANSVACYGANCTGVQVRAP